MNKLLLILAFMLLPVTCMATDFYCDPVGGDTTTGDGSTSSPWGTLESVITAGKIESYQRTVFPYDESTESLSLVNSGAPVTSGDTIYLLDGYHGIVSMTNLINTDYIKFVGVGLNAQLGYVDLVSVQYWSFDNVKISSSFLPVPTNIEYMFSSSGHGWTGGSDHVQLLNSDIFTVLDASPWTAQNWIDNASGGVNLSCAYSLVSNVNITNVAGGVVMSGATSSVVENSTIDHSSLDGVRIIESNFAKFTGNTVKNIVLVLDYEVYHYDLLQSWTTDTETEGVEISGNTFIAWDGNTISGISGEYAQGIGLFDGWFKNYVIENNVVVVNSSHGITITGAIDCEIANNTVSHRTDITSLQHAPIWIASHKTAGSSTGNIIANNFADYILDEGSSIKVSNIVGYTSDVNFTGADNFDFTLLSTSTAIGTGSSAYAPSTDILGLIRSDLPSIGAYAYNGTPPTTTTSLFQFGGGVYILKLGE